MIPTPSSDSTKQCETVTTSIVESIADHKGIDSGELDIVLADYIEPDAVKQLARHSDNSWRLQFELSTHRVTVRGDGGVLVDGQLEHNWVSD
ncbi:HalOD1 output domain-containing protein [Halorubrum ejinorense]|uniref:HalOD1 output domain-containing protein n=1 Tax=Halorubrum ejinorense TaxID=425309 RepID=A0AAV3SSB0_9EURY